MMIQRFEQYINIPSPVIHLYDKNIDGKHVIRKVNLNRINTPIKNEYILNNKSNHICNTIFDTISKDISYEMFFCTFDRHFPSGGCEYSNEFD